MEIIRNDLRHIWLTLGIHHRPGFNPWEVGEVSITVVWPVASVSAKFQPLHLEALLQRWILPVGVASLATEVLLLLLHAYVDDYWVVKGLEILLLMLFQGE